MGIKKSLKDHLGEGFNVKKWMGTENIKTDTRNLLHITKETLNAPKSSIKTETFEESLARLQLTEADVKKRMRTSLQILICLLVLMGGLLLYSFYLWHLHLYRSVSINTVLMILIGSYAFREHFHYFQMKQRKLGCTVIEWFKYLAGGK